MHFYRGGGDVAGITLITPGRTSEFAYATPIFDNIREVVVTRKGDPAISRLEDLSGREVYGQWGQILNVSRL